MKRSEGRILTTHTGSLPRTDELAQLLVSQSRGEAVDPESFRTAVDASTEYVIRQQERAGVNIANNGEQSRPSFSTYVTFRMSGFGGRGERRTPKDLSEYPTTSVRARGVDIRNTPKCIGPVHYERLDEVERECDDLLRQVRQGNADFPELFMTAPSPGIVALTMLNEHYRSYEDYVMALAEEMRKEYEVVASKGLLLQLDCPDLAMERHYSQQDQPLSAFLELVRLNIRALNTAIRNMPADQIRLHVCWGNYAGTHHYDVPLAEILPLLYEANVGALALEMANPRHAHEYKVFRRYPLPDHMLLVAGVIDTKTNYIEHPEVVADRIALIAQTIGDPSRVLAGTDCGFATTAGSDRVHPEVVWEKLKSLREGADLASQSLSWSN
jgi:5-methyltetrahydropteroyltriglutamate--homocysteine methyltransferase